MLDSGRRKSLADWQRATTSEKNAWSQGKPVRLSIPLGQMHLIQAGSCWSPGCLQNLVIGVNRPTCVFQFLRLATRVVTLTIQVFHAHLLTHFVDMQIPRLRFEHLIGRSHPAGDYLKYGLVESWPILMQLDANPVFHSTFWFFSMPFWYSLQAACQILSERSVHLARTVKKAPFELLGRPSPVRFFWGCPAYL